jgi:hypothetical protein
MKRFWILSTLILCVLFTTNAQDKKMSIGLGFGGAAASNKDDAGVKDSGFGINFYANVMWNLNPKLTVGLEFNGSVVVIGGLDGTTIEATSINGNLLKAKYFLGDGGTVKPFVGVMTGIYGIRPSVVDSNGAAALTLERKISFGFAPEIGIQLGSSFQIATSYQFPGTYKSDTIGDISYNVWQFNIGWNIGLIDN